jgi:hypothetical protein
MGIDIFLFKSFDICHKKTVTVEFIRLKFSQY